MPDVFRGVVGIVLGVLIVYEAPVILQRLTSIHDEAVDPPPAWFVRFVRLLGIGIGGVGVYLLLVGGS